MRWQILEIYQICTIYIISEFIYNDLCVWLTCSPCIMINLHKRHNQTVICSCLIDRSLKLTNLSNPNTLHRIPLGNSSAFSWELYINEKDFPMQIICDLKEQSSWGITHQSYFPYDHSARNVSRMKSFEHFFRILYFQDPKIKKLRMRC